MRFFRSGFILFLLFLQISVFAQPIPEGVKQPRILVLLDGSSSMVQPWANDATRFKTAGRIITSLMDSIYQVNDQVEFALRVYGHQSPVQDNNCFDTKREVMFSKNNLTQMYLRVNSIHPMGVSPIAFSLKEAAELDLVDEAHYAYSIILITDGGESCSGNICDVVKTLLEKKIYFKPYILSLVDYKPLKQEYDCLGNYLTVANEKEIKTAIETIVESYRKALTMPNIVSKGLPVTTTAPKVNTVVPPKIVIKQPELPKDTVSAIKPHTAPVSSSPVVTVPAVPILAKEIINPMQTFVPLRLFPVFFATPSYHKINVPAVTYIKPDPVPVVTAPKPVEQPKPVTPPAPKPVVKPANPTNVTTTATNNSKPKEAPFTIETEDATETTVQVYFTDGHGKSYSSTPQLIFNDAHSNKTVTKFYRTVDGNGNPDPQKLQAGTYNISTLGHSVTLMKNVTIVDKKKNKVIVKVSNGSLKFVYLNNPKRPVKEYDALITKRFDGRVPATKQHCTAELEYEPGNYYGEVNTLPVTRFNTDIDFGGETVVAIQEPGFLEIVNPNNYGKVILYYQLGEKFLSFYTFNTANMPKTEPLDLRPGPYEAHFIKTPNIPYSKETVIPFTIKSNENTQITLQ